MMARPAEEIRDWLVPVYNAVLVYEEAMRQGVNARDLIRGTGFSVEDLKNSDTLKTYDQNLALVDNALRLCPLPGLGLRIGREESPAQWGILGYATMCCKTLREMIAMLIKYHRVAASLAELYFREDDRSAYVEACPPRAIHSTLPFVVEEHFSSILSVARKLTDRPDMRPVEVNLSYAGPPYAAMYREIFGCPVRFNRPSNILVFDRKWLKSPVKYSTSLSSQMAERICEMQLRRQYVEHDLVHRVRYLLLEHADAFPSAEDIAKILHMTSRTLRNRLHEKGTSFQAILDDLRHQLAVDYLEKSELSLAEISALTGFNDASNFRRAFKKWTGTTPSEFRAAAVVPKLT
jgi:AraC-like DNA-binding protein